MVAPLSPDALYRRCDPDAFAFETTRELDALDGVLGQGRAVAALRFGLGMRHKGYNLFALGPAGTGKHALIRRFVEARAAGEPVPPDWCYVFNFETPHRPRALRLPAGTGLRLKRDLERLVRDLHGVLRSVFESDEYRTRTQSVHEELEERQEQAMGYIQEKAKEKHVGLMRTPTGFTLAPLEDGKPMDPEAFHALSEAQREAIKADIDALQDEMRAVLHQVPQWQRQTEERIEALNREVAAAAVKHLLETLCAEYQGLAQVVVYLRQVEADVIEHYQRFLPDQEERAQPRLPFPSPEEGPPWHQRYQVNVMLAHEANGGAPVVYADLPSHNNLVGRVEHRAQLGALVTDFTMIRPGALHRANGGYLILDALKVLMEPFAWETLKRVLRAEQIRIESLAEINSLISTLSLEPEPIALEVKILLVGERRTYYLLSQLDPEFAELFKVAVDFDDYLPWAPDQDLQFARLIAATVAQEGLKPFGRAAVARVIEHAARLVEHRERLTSHMRSLRDLLREADFWAGEAGGAEVGAEDVQQAIDAQIARADRVDLRLKEELLRGTQLIDTAGEKVGQVNGLVVMGLGGYSFGHPARITARARVGRGQLVDIEREAKLGGPLHSKGVMILAGYLSGRFALDHPLSLSATLVLEQSYGGVEGDSASSAELYALLSALADVPIRQSLAVTGSVSQLGEVQAIGGVNQKIEGFFAACRDRGLTGEQGVLVPAANVPHLMLKREVVEAVTAGRFAIYAIAHVDEGIALLTGLVAGERDSDGAFPEGSVNRKVEDRLIRFAELMRSQQKNDKNDKTNRGQKNGSDDPGGRAPAAAGRDHQGVP